MEKDLETMIDKRGLRSVLDALAYICYEKAEHLATNWQDRGGEENWNNAGLAIHEVCEVAAIIKVSP